MMDLVIRGGVVVDGTGAAPRRADVAVRDGRIVAIGEDATEASADRTIDADGLVVAPGFVDLHTHYDAQLLWDPTASPSPLHGVTTVLGGNCGFALAPAGPDDTDWLGRLMAKVEGIPLEAIHAALDWEWRSFGDYLERLDGSIAVNAGFLAGHTALRRAVMGERATGGAATAADLETMAALLGRCLDEGALGLSTSQAPTHHDGDGQPVPSRAASREELLALATEVGRHSGTQLELIVPGCINGFSDDEVTLLGDLSLAADRPLNWNVLVITGLAPDRHKGQLAASATAAARGACVVALTLPQGMRVRFTFRTGTVLDGLPGWGELFALPIDERMRVLADPAERRRLDELAKRPEAGMIGALANWEILTVAETFAAENAQWEERSIRDIAAETGKDPFDALLDIVLADDLRTGLRPPFIEESPDIWAERRRVWSDPAAVVGGSDAGAHLDMMCGASYSTFLVGEAVRDRHLLPIEEAVRLLTDAPARLYGLRDRGRIAEGWIADLVVFDPDTVAPERERTVRDLPGGAERLTAGAVGMTHVIVGGVPIASDGAFTGATPGTVLRSGRDTQTVTNADALGGRR